MRCSTSSKRWSVLVKNIGRSLLDVAIAGLAAMPAIASVIAGATKPEQVRTNATAGEWELSSDELAKLRSALI